MPDPIRNQGPVTKPRLEDPTPPPTPVLSRAIAFEPAPADATFSPPRRPQPALPRPQADPLYIALNNVEAGVTVELVNLSRNPEASFSDPSEVVKLPITGRDVSERTAAIYLDDDQMQALDIGAGDRFRLRVVDGSGNASGAIDGKIDHREFAARGADLYAGDRRIGRGARLHPLLDGEGQRKPMIGMTVEDRRPPQLRDAGLELVCRSTPLPAAQRAIFGAISGQWRKVAQAVAPAKRVGGRTLDRRAFAFNDVKRLSTEPTLPANLRAVLAKLAADPELFAQVAKASGNPARLEKEDVRRAALAGGVVALAGKQVVEPGAEVTVQNQRTGETKSFTAGADGGIEVPLDGVTDGDRLIVNTVDGSGVAGKRLELVYGHRFPDGRAPVLDPVVGTRLPGVI